MIERYAPQSENNTSAYTSAVSRLSGVAADAVLDTHSAQIMCRFVAAMSRVENATPAVWADVAEGWKLFEADF